jgi:hypothetical protein
MLWFVFGALVCAKQMWAVNAALVLSYLALIASLSRFQICGVVLLVVVILHAHRVLGWAKELAWAGIPLTMKPENLRVPISLPG